MGDTHFPDKDAEGVNQRMERYTILSMKSAIKQKVNRAYLDLLGYSGYQRFAVVAHARTGSNYLLAGLRSSKAVDVRHEIFSGQHRTKGEGFESILSEAFDKKKRQIKAAGFKVFYYHLTDSEWTALASDSALKIIHLTRANRLRTVVSQQIALATDQWQTVGQRLDVKDKKVRLDPSTLVNRLSTIRDQEHLTRERFQRHKILEVSYEEMVKNPKDAFRKIGAFLNIDDIDISQIKLKKQNSETLEDLVSNYEEVVQALEHTEFAPNLVL